MMTVDEARARVKARGLQSRVEVVLGIAAGNPEVRGHVTTGASDVLDAQLDGLAVLVFAAHVAEKGVDQTRAQRRAKFRVVKDPA